MALQGKRTYHWKSHTRFQTKCQSNVELLGQAITICHRENFICLKIAPKQGCSVGWRESAGCWVQTCPPPRKKGSFCEAAILIATWQSIPRTILIWCTMCSCWWYIYISFVFAVAAAFCHGETKYAKRSKETEWILGALIPTQSYMCCSKLNTVFEMISDGSYATNRRQIALLSWQGMFLSYMFLPFNSPSVIQERW